MQETWKPIAGYEGLYEVSDLGRVRSLNYKHTGEVRVMEPTKEGSGYLQLRLCKNNKRKHFLVHRLVALAFIPNPNNLQQVNHLNEDKTDNRVMNLEWVSAKENCNHGTRNERLSISVVQLTLDYQFVKKWIGMREVERYEGFSSRNINKCCLHKRSTTAGYRWFYLSEYERICFKIITTQHPFHLTLPYRA